MITPRFSLDQTDVQLIINVYAPYTNVKDTEIEVIEDCVIFYSTPYYLRLTLPGQVQETDDSNAHYNADEGKYTITLNKVTPGEHFANLEMLTTLLQPKTQSRRVKPLIEVISSSGLSENICDLEDITEDDWFIEQTVDEEMPPASSTSQLLNSYCYGFLNSHKGLCDKYSLELGEVAEIKNPDGLSESERRKQRIETEQSKFSDEHYLADLMENEDVAVALQFKFDTKSLKELTERNRETLKELGKREFLIDSKITYKRVYLALVDILYAYCYDWRVTDGKHCCESPWNISRLSATLSWFDAFDSVHEVIHSCLRRSLAYPVLRHWKLSRRVMKDVKKVLKTGPTGILVCLLDIHDIFRKKDPYYLLNQLYIEQYCVWIQRVPADSLTLATIIVALEKGLENYEKDQAGFDLVELEAAAVACEDEAMEEEISEIVKNVNIG